MIHEYKKYLQKQYTQLPLPNTTNIPWKFAAFDSSFFEPSSHSFFVEQNKQEKIVLCDMQDFFTFYPELAQKYLVEHIKKILFQHQWSIFAHAYAEKQWVVYVPANVHIADSFTLDIQDATVEQITIIIGEGSHVTLHEKMFAKRGKRIKNVDVIVEQNAQCTFVAEYNDAHDMVSYLQYRFFVHAHAHLNSNFTLLGGKTTFTHIDVQLCAPGAQADIKGLYILDSNRQSIVTTRQYHAYKQTMSNLLIKGIVTDAAHAVYYGTINIEKNAPKTEAYQENKNIVLNEDAKVFSQPNLEIQTDDVRCKHGSAIGKFDADQLLYMQSRGLSLELTQKLLLQAFIADVSCQNIDLNLL